eukprot:1358573-Amorphochlora_amoeboformis.AAC.2
MQCTNHYGSTAGSRARVTDDFLARRTEILTCCVPSSIVFAKGQRVRHGVTHHSGYDSDHLGSSGSVKRWQHTGIVTGCSPPSPPCRFAVPQKEINHFPTFWSTHSFHTDFDGFLSILMPRD